MRPTDEPPDDKAHEHHGVAEKLREEIEEVVEHVPEPVRWTVGKIVRLVLLGLVALVVLGIVSVIAYFANRTELVARETAILINQTLAARSNVVLDLRDLRGNPLSGFRALNPRVRFRQGGDELVVASELRFEYPAWNLLRGGRGPLRVTLVEPVIHVTRDADGHLRLPTWKGGPRRGPARAFDVDVKLVRARIVAPAPIGTIDSLMFDGRASTGSEPQVLVRSLTWARGPWDSRLQALAGRYEQRHDSTRVTLTELHTPDVVLRGTARWATGSRAPVRTVDARVERVRWRWLAQVFDNGTLDVAGEGAAHVLAEGDRSWRGAFQSKLTWDSLAVDGTGRFAWDGTTFAIDSLRGHSLAGDLDGRVRWAKSGWEVSGDARDADPAHWDALNLHGWPEGRLNGWFRYFTDTRHEKWSRLESRLTASEWTGWNVDSARVRVEFPAVAMDSFVVTGWRRGGRFTLDARVDPKGWGGPFTIADFPLEEWPDGRASGLRGMLTSGEGRVESRDGDLNVSGTLLGGVTDWSAAHFARWQADSIAGRLLPVPDLTARVRAADGFFVGLHVDSAHAHVALGDETIAFPDLVVMAGDTVMTGTGDAHWHADRWALEFSQAAVRSTQLAWVAEPPLRLAGDPAGVITERLVAHDGDGTLRAQGRWASPGGFYDFTAEGHGVDVSRVGFPPEWGLGGRAGGTLRVTGPSGDPRWSFRGAAGGPAFDGHAADSLGLALSGAAHRLEVERVDLALDGGHAQGALSVADMVAWPDSLTGTAILRWIATAQAWRGQGGTSRLPVVRLSQISPQPGLWHGALTGRMTLAGSPARPTFEGKAEVDSFAWRDYQSDRLGVTVRFADGRLEVPRAELEMLDVTSTAHGEMPLRLALGRPVEVPDEPMQWSVQVPRGDLRLLPLLVPQIQAARGRFDLAAEVAGTPKAPRLNGTGHVRDGVVRPAGRQEVLDQVYADLRFDESTVTLDTLGARQGRAGAVRGRGSLDLRGPALGRYRFDLQLRDFTAAEQGLYAMLFDGDFVVTDGPLVGGTRLPEVTGDLHLQKGVVELDFANQTEVQQIAARTQPLYWTYRVHLDATNNLRWRPPDGEIEFDADLDLEQTPDSLLIFGEMHALRGTYWFLSNRFTVSKADLTFDNQAGVDPLLDVAAGTQVKVDGNGSGSVTETITATLTGRASTPTIALVGPPGWDQQRILAELTYLRFGLGATASNQGLSKDPFDNYLTQQLNRQLSNELSEFFRGAINEWEIERDRGGLFTGVGDLFVRVGAQVTPQLAVRYGQRLPTGAALPTNENLTLFERDVEAEYRLNRFIYLTTELAQRRQSANTTPGADFNLNLKARWEY